LPILISGGLGIALSSTLFFAVGGWERSHLKAMFYQQAEIRAAAVHQRLVTSLEVLSGVGTFYAVSPQIDRQAFRIMASRIVDQHPEIQVIEWAPRMAGEHFSVAYAEPPAGNEPVVGFDLFSDGTRRLAMERARDTGELVMTSRVQVLQEETDQPGVVAFVPIYRDGAAYDTLRARRDNLQGFVAAVFRLRDLV